MEPWFEWSWLLGIKPIHPYGWLLVALFWSIEIPLMFAVVGYFELATIHQLAAVVGFVAVGLTAFAITFWKLKDRDEQ